MPSTAVSRHCYLVEGFQCDYAEFMKMSDVFTARLAAGNQCSPTAIQKHVKLVQQNHEKKIFTLSTS